MRCCLLRRSTTLCLWCAWTEASNKANKAEACARGSLCCWSCSTTDQGNFLGILFRSPEEFKYMPSPLPHWLVMHAEFEYLKSISKFLLIRGLLTIKIHSTFDKRKMSQIVGSQTNFSRLYHSSAATMEPNMEFYTSLEVHQLFWWIFFHTDINMWTKRPIGFATIFIIHQAYAIISFSNLKKQNQRLPIEHSICCQ
jgi:hypothetical protein